ncbi:MAG: D-2-hydroxyacid dehydrogenase [Candidatus Palauibacterales bacterium]|nr:D-2-hydroxyacid dehydrogenase [Candidatus Palauibacterales bacterium]MDP2528805.1 D-2-hydroxyacid dehydrogenase [Candidatus Palauibacterales bacterium]
MSRKLLVWMHAPEYPLWSMPEVDRARLRQSLPEDWTATFLEEPGYFAGDGARRVPERLLEEIRDAEVYAGFGIPRRAFQEARDLRWVHSGASGVGASLFEEMVESDVVLTNSAGLHAEPLAEHALALMLHFSRGLDVAAAGKARREWRHGELAGSDSPLVELAGRTLGVVGYGGIGSAVGRRGAALGMRVVAVRRTSTEAPPEVERAWDTRGLPELLGQAHYVVLTLPETDETRGLLGESLLGRLRPDAVLINLSRGGIVEETALARALASGRLRGAGLDVFEQEPLPSDSPLWDLENVVVTPHAGAVSPRYWERETALLLDNLRRYLDGRALVNVVDKQRGY